jgi:hypothetical protein
MGCGLWVGLCVRAPLHSYFTALAKGDVESFLEEQAKKKKIADAAALSAAGAASGGAQPAGGAR